MLKCDEEYCIISPTAYKGMVNLNRIRELRLQKGWRQEDLAVLMHTKQQTVARYETEQLGIDADTICQLCDIFGCTADYLLGRSLLPTYDLTEEEAALLLAWRSAEPHIKDGIRALLRPYWEESAADVS